MTDSLSPDVPALIAQRYAGGTLPELTLFMRLVVDHLRPETADAILAALPSPGARFAFVGVVQRMAAHHVGTAPDLLPAGLRVGLAWCRDEPPTIERARRGLYQASDDADRCFVHGVGTHDGDGHGDRWAPRQVVYETRATSRDGALRLCGERAFGEHVLWSDGAERPRFARVAPRSATRTPLPHAAWWPDHDDDVADYVGAQARRVSRGLYRHAKGDVYFVHGVAIDTLRFGGGDAALGYHVVYDSARSSTDGLLRIRTVDAFTEPVAWPDGVVRPRFVRVE